MTIPNLLLALVIAVACSAANIPKLPLGWTYVGCLYEANGTRIMTEEFWLGDRGQTIEDCVSYCQAIKKTPYAALEMGDQCFCGDSLDYVRPVPEERCDYPCTGDSTQKCGGWGHMSFFSISKLDPRISAGLIDPPRLSSTSSSVTPSTRNQKPTMEAIQSASVTLISASAGSQETAVASSDSPLQGGQGQSPGFTLPADIAAPSSPLSPTTASDAQSISMPPGFSVSLRASTPNQPLRVMATSAASGLSASGIEHSANGNPKLKDDSQIIVYGQYVSSASSLNPISIISTFCLLLALCLPL